MINRRLLLFLCIILLTSCKEIKRYYLYQGEIFHTTFHIKYEYNKPLDAEIDSLLKAFDLSLNPFNKNSIIYKVNHNIPVEVDDWFIRVFNQSQEVSRQSNGAFDITCAPLINLWGFGFDNSKAPTQAAIDSVKQFVGYNKIRLVGRTVEKDDPRVMLNASAIAKGYSCDVVARMLESRGITNYMVEIGGEIVTKGVNPSNTCWRVEITKPEDDDTGQSLGRQEVISLCEGGLATSGNYRNYHIREGKKYAHTIDPATGYPVDNGVLSASVIMPECILADAYATVFMLWGVKADSLAQTIEGLSYYLIYDEGGKQLVKQRNMEKYLKHE